MKKQHVTDNEAIISIQNLCWARKIGTGAGAGIQLCYNTQEYLVTIRYEGERDRNLMYNQLVLELNSSGAENEK